VRSSDEATRSVISVTGRNRPSTKFHYVSETRLSDKDNAQLRAPSDLSSRSTRLSWRRLQQLAVTLQRQVREAVRVVWRGGYEMILKLMVLPKFTSSRIRALTDGGMVDAIPCRFPRKLSIQESEFYPKFCTASSIGTLASETVAGPPALSPPLLPRPRIPRSRASSKATRTTTK
jgi:hypothetical protein